MTSKSPNFFNNYTKYGQPSNIRQKENYSKTYRAANSSKYIKNNYIQSARNKTKKSSAQNSGKVIIDGKLKKYSAEAFCSKSRNPKEFGSRLCKQHSSKCYENS